MIPTDCDLLQIPGEFRVFRDQLRAVGYELVHYKREFAQAAARAFRHPVCDYEYAIHKIESVTEEGQLQISPIPFFTCAARISDWTRHFQEKESPAKLGLFARFFREPSNAIVTLVAAPYGLALFGLTAFGDRANAERQAKLLSSLPAFVDLPAFIRRHARNES
jgi:hypothetical protein